MIPYYKQLSKLLLWVLPFVSGLARAQSPNTTTSFQTQVGSLASSAPSPVSVVVLNWRLSVYTTGNAQIGQTSANGVGLSAASSFLTEARIGVTTLASFKLTQLKFRVTTSILDGRTITLTGYRAGAAVSGATITYTNYVNPASGSFNTATPANTAFNDVDEIRITYSGANVAAGINIAEITIVTAIPIPAAPSNLQRNVAATYTPTDITLQWTDNSTNEDNFVLERGRRTTTSQPNTDPAIVWTAVSPAPAANTTSYRDYAATGLTANQFGYFYRIKAVNVTGSSSYANNSDGALPVTLRYFNGRMTEAGALLGWQTATESNNARFSIERSRDALSFEVIGNVPSQAPQGNSATLLTYSFTDPQPLPGVNYYRLTQTDYNGTRTVHKIIALSRENQPPVLYPNPVGTLGEATLEPALPHRGYQLSDVQGRVLLQQAEPGTLSRVSLALLPAGVYTLQLQTESGPQIFRIMK